MTKLRWLRLVSQVRDYGHTRDVDLRVLPIRDPNGKEQCWLILFEEQPQGESRGARAKGKLAIRAQVNPGPRRPSRTWNKNFAPRGIICNRLSNPRKRRTEELRSANEEAQATNEELDTAKEELQASNEELNTVNDELRARNLEQGALNSDLRKLLGKYQRAAGDGGEESADSMVHAGTWSRSCICFRPIRGGRSRIFIPPRSRISGISCWRRSRASRTRTSKCEGPSGRWLSLRHLALPRTG